MNENNYDIEIEYCHDIVLIDAGESRAKVIGLIRKLNYTNISIADIQTMIDNPPSVIAECLDQQYAGQIKRKFESLGATVKLNRY